MANTMTRQSVINTVYAELRHPAEGMRRPDRVMAMLNILNCSMDEIGRAMEAFGDIPVGTVDART